MAEDPKTITRATRLMWTAHNLERAADRVTNICERVVFIVNRENGRDRGFEILAVTLARIKQ